jgi:hypothetical protein
MIQALGIAAGGEFRVEVCTILCAEGASVLCFEAFLGHNSGKISLQLPGTRCNNARS